MGRVALIDGDLLLYREAAGCERHIQFTDDPENAMWVVEDFEVARSRAEQALDALLARVKAEHAIVCLSCPSSEGFRRQVLPTYKAKRSPRKPEHLAALKDWMRSELTVYERPLLEADDLLGILATAPHMLKEYTSRVIVSGDKDLLTIPGTLFNPDKGTVHKTDEPTANLRFYTQVLTGDPVDGYTGIPGIGKVKAQHILATAMNDGVPLWSAIVAAYEKHGLTEQDALVQARVARILRFGEFDFKTKQPILWSPPHG